MSRLRRSLALLLVVGAIASPVAAQTFRIDDSASQVLTPGEVPMRWDAPVPRPGEASTISGRVTVRVVLDVSPWRGRQGRIYHRLAPSPSGPVTARWTADGPLAPGTVRDGERALVYAGPIASDRLIDTFRLTLQADGDRVLRPQTLDFSFEIELEPAP
jgi:hypothetical protein